MKITRWATTSVALMLSAGLAATAAGSIDNNNSADGTGTTPPPDAGKSAMVKSVSPTQSASFAILGSPGETGDDPMTGPEGPFGANLSLAREVMTSAGTVRVVPASGMVCLRAETTTGAAWTCVADQDAKNGRLILTLRKPGAKDRDAVFALLPDSAKGAASSSTRGDEAVAVRENVVALTATQADALSFTDERGARISIPLP